MKFNSIWIVNCYDQPDGQSRRIFDFAKYFVKYNYNVTAFTNNYCHFQKIYIKIMPWYSLWFIEEWNGVKVIWLKSIPYSNNGLLRFINALFNSFLIFLYTISKHKEKCNILIAPSVPIQTGYFGLFIAKWKKAKYIYEIRDLWPIALVEMGAIKKKSLVYLLFRYMEKVIYTKADYIVSTLENVIDHIKFSGGNPNNVMIIPNGIDFHHDQLTNISSTSSINNDVKFICKYFGGFSDDHDVELIIEAAFILKNLNYHNIYFEIYGEGKNWNKCKNMAENFGILGNNIFISKPIAKKYLLQNQVNANLLLIAIKDTASFNYGLNLNKLLFYFLSSKPILISSGISNNPIIKSNSGLSVPPNSRLYAEAILEIYHWTPEECTIKGKNGFNFAKNNLDLNFLVSKYFTIFDQFKSKF